MATPEQQQLIALTTMMFNAPPGAQYLAELEEQLAEGQSFADIAVILTQTPLFNSQFTDLESDRQKIDLVLSTVGIDDQSDAYEEAFNFFQMSLANGEPPGLSLQEAANFLNTTEEENFTQASATFRNKVETGVTHSVELGLSSENLSELKEAIANVTSDPQSVARAAQLLREQMVPQEPGEGGGSSGGGIPSYMLERALEIKEDGNLPTSYNINANTPHSVAFSNIEDAVKGANGAYEVLKGASNLPTDGSVADVEGQSTDLLNAKFVELFKYSINLQSSNLEEIDVVQGLTLFYADKFLDSGSMLLGGLDDLNYIVKDTLDELLDITTGLVPAENELLKFADKIIADGSLTVGEANMLKSHLQKAEASDVQIEFNIVDTLENIIQDNQYANSVLNDAASVTASDEGDIEIEQATLVVIEARGIELSGVNSITVSEVTTEVGNFVARDAINLLGSDDVIVFADEVAELDLANFDAVFVLSNVASTSGDTITVNGTDGNDVIDASGQDANFILNGFDGDDTLNGGNGNDIINGGNGANMLTGGAGADTFVFNHTDIGWTITDFEAGTAGGNDKLDLDTSVVKNTGVQSYGSDGFHTMVNGVSIINAWTSSLSLEDVENRLAGVLRYENESDVGYVIVGRSSGTGVYLAESSSTSSTIVAEELTLIGTLDQALLTRSSDIA